ncbi:hypothetical protein [uncultured Croceitalea sp.]|uniref:hypothetical protein n=1 Tax=uncultured Croceitalea sp. TaxID=1798908 RepID=UPI0033064831
MKNINLIIILFGCICFGQQNVKVSPAFSILNEFDKVRDFTINQSGDEAYFSIQSQTENISVICKSVKNTKEWGTPTIASFSGKHKDLEPFLSPDGLRLYFVSDRQLSDTISGSKDFDIWFVERENPSKEWSKPKNIGAPINTEHNEFYPAIAANGNLYFTSDNPKAIGRDDIFFSEFSNNSYRAPISLSENINSEGFEYNAYISKDESYLLFGGYNREDGQGSGDIYISYKNGDAWSKATPLPKAINSKFMDYCPFVDETTNTLYFTSRRTKGANKDFKNLGALKNFLHSYENGNSRIYKASIDLKQ